MLNTMTVTFYFDPGCPWTWLTSRWLTQVADKEGFAITWRSFSLPYVNRDKDTPEALKEAMAADTAAHRIIQVLQARGDDDAIARFYEALGTRFHSRGEELSVELVRTVTGGVGLGADVLAAIDDEALDGPVGESTEEALCLTGPDIGSPVLCLGDERFALMGPIIDAVPDGDESQRLWEAVQMLATVPQFHELKRGRRHGPAVEDS